MRPIAPVPRETDIHLMADGRTTIVIIDPNVCEGAGVCEQVCPEDVFLHNNGKTRVVRSTSCTYCWICVENCVSNAITLE
jgi:NAD-dependent dihydropyrimidine dehydrogenase PreA subunit